LQHNRSLNICGAGVGGIDGIDPLNQQARRDPIRNLHSLWLCCIRI
jgi:hypothetical protein